MIKTVLAIETSCDDTSVAIVGKKSEESWASAWVHAVVSANQDLAHAPFGGIVPEIACRNHSANLIPLIEECFNKSGCSWRDIDGLAVTSRPGLTGSLIVGLVTAKTISQGRNIPFVGINHLEGHILAPFLRDTTYTPLKNLEFPFICLAVSGGHSSLYFVKGLGQYELLGATVDDAAGEAFDKFAKNLGLGWPGGVKVDQLAKSGNPKKYEFPRGMIKEENYMMSFSGLKAAGQRQVEAIGMENLKDHLSDLCASYQEAIVDVLITKLDRAMKHLKVKTAVITGGVSANSRLRDRAEAWAKSSQIELIIPPIRFCTDNAAMIGYAGILRMQTGEFSDLSLGPSPSSLPQDFQEHKDFAAGTGAGRPLKRGR